MAKNLDEFLASCGVAFAGFAMWSVLFGFLATRQLQPLL